MEIAKKITLLFAILSAIIISLLSGFVWYFSNDFAFEDFYKRLEARVNIAAQIKLYEDGNNKVYAKMRNQYLERLPSEKEYIIEAGKTPGKVDRELPSTFYDRIKAGYMARYRVENHFYAGKYFKYNDNGYIVIVSANDPFGFRELKDLQRILIIGFFLSVILSFVVGWKFSNYMLMPLRNIIKSVKKIKAENLHLRLDVKKGNDEMSQLAQTFNNMLNRLETAFETQNNFISNASHELRTPLTIISAEVELAMKSIEDTAKQEKALAKIKDEAERLEHILTSLLGLAQSGFNGKNQPWEEVRMDELLWEIKESVNQVHPNSKIEIDFTKLPDDEELLTLRANKNLMKLAISNIVNNACKYSNENLVNISIESNANMLSIAVTDKGIGIPQTDIQHIFEPFYRASNTNDFKGYGVGLPLSLNIIRLHRGSIAIKSQEGIGSEIKVLLPTKS
ncbi:MULTISPECIES: sensor histidine kinase [unclassified Pedobacter]|uniref:sensor histidine kinase n=1 Tax=unclassified Pedobacter TaxID=2628915 RepID=UPI00142161BF|nr:MULTISPECIES: HAMP domain-containing sensor histidine kinase [unclassified Pedobacter]NII81572.1 signal transduction histidine kinase [Pedobacter sp. SG908]NMN35576.1 signal transduction histidine kinase [Pedobacter sp. SG918]